MSVWYEIAMAAREIAQQLAAPFRWLRYPRRFAREPCICWLPRIANRFRIFKYTRIGHQPQESNVLVHGRPTGPELLSCCSSQSRR
jgi:hypothetical protein